MCLGQNGNGQPLGTLLPPWCQDSVTGKDIKTLRAVKRMVTVSATAWHKLLLFLFPTGTPPVPGYQIRPCPFWVSWQQPLMFSPFSNFFFLFSHYVVSNSLWPHGLQHSRLLFLLCLPEFAQIHVHWVGEAMQVSHPLLPSSSLTFNLSQHQGLSQWVSSLHQVAKVLELKPLPVHPTNFSS